jgi:predicted O-methyltransferase YrrM
MKQVFNNDLDMTITRFDANPEFGQLCISERKALYTIAIKNRCKKILEVGTWRGVGSTYILASAARANSGMLHTIENDKTNYELAKDIYNTELSFLIVYLQLIFGDSTETIKKLIPDNTYDMLFLDGGEDGDKTFEDFTLVEDQITIVACHDWGTIKTSKIRPYLEKSNRWKQICLIEETPTGFAAYKKTKES